jgi:hypothetical protein
VTRPSDAFEVLFGPYIVFFSPFFPFVYISEQLDNGYMYIYIYCKQIIDMYIYIFILELDNRLDHNYISCIN